MININKLKHRLVIQRPVEAQDNVTGAMNVSWQDVATVWAAIEPISAREFITAQAENSKITSRITIRYRSDFDPSCRLYHAHSGKYYNIEGLLSDKDTGLEYITLPCSDGVRYVNAPISAAPSVLENPSIIGTPTIGFTLISLAGVWANDPDEYEYQWYLDNMPITGEVGLSLIVPNDPGAALKFGVKAINSAGESPEAFSSAVIISS